VEQRTLRSIALAATVVPVLVPAVLLGEPAWTAWAVSGAATVSIEVATLPTGPTPHATAHGDTVTITWPRTTLGHGYEIFRYGAAGEPQHATAQCAGVITTATCTEPTVPAGTWRYTIRVWQNPNWIGTDGPLSNPVTVQPSANPQPAANPTAPQAPRTPSPSTPTPSASHPSAAPEGPAQPTGAVSPSDSASPASLNNPGQGLTPAGRAID
jgi:hypothetical protein